MMIREQKWQRIYVGLEGESRPRGIFPLTSDQTFRGDMGKRNSLQTLICIANTTTILVNPHHIELVGRV